MTAKSSVRLHEAEAQHGTGSSASLATVVWLATAVLGLGSFALLTALVSNHTALAFDLPLLDLARSWAVPSVVWRAISEASNIPLIVLGVGTVLWLLWKRDYREAILVIVVLAAVTAGSEAVKQLVARPRPPGSDTVVPGVVYSFPSGHVLEAVTVLGIIAVLVWRSRLSRIVGLLTAVLVGLFVSCVAVARVALDAHYPSDVLAGFLAGIGVLAIFILLSRRPHRRPPAQPG